MHYLLVALAQYLFLEVLAVDEDHFYVLTETGNIDRVEPVDIRCLNGSLF